MMDKNQAAVIAGDQDVVLDGDEARDMVQELGAGFIAALSILRDVRNDLRQSRFDTCETCSSVSLALRGLPQDEIDRMLKELE